MTAEKRKVSYTDLQTWPEDGRRYELYDGEVYVCPDPMPRHQLVLAELHDRLRQYAARHGGRVLTSPIDIVFDEHNVLQPDIALFTAERRHHAALDKVIRVPPDVVVEVVSPSTIWNDLGRKKATFARFGVGEYWLVDPYAERIECQSLSGGAFDVTLSAGPHETFRSTLLSSFRCEVDSLFPR